MSVRRGEEQPGALRQSRHLVGDESAVAAAKTGVDHERRRGAADDRDVGISIDDEDMGRQLPRQALAQHDIGGLPCGMIRLLRERCCWRDGQTNKQ
jgi:hypothetical protein